MEPLGAGAMADAGLSGAGAVPGSRGLSGADAGAVLGADAGAALGAVPGSRGPFVAGTGPGVDPVAVPGVGAAAGADVVSEWPGVGPVGDGTWGVGRGLDTFELRSARSGFGRGPPETGAEP
ncbi:hypothetical protein GCM10010393_19660 [Streptomyces gobitricini]|uniref:Uncharacterized protein n=1 Tax=Streptomyces gobitricini TaxID=68211 RepID=A0ABP5Z2C0_9ACTN